MLGVARRDARIPRHHRRTQSMRRALFQQPPAPRSRRRPTPACPAHWRVDRHDHPRPSRRAVDPQQPSEAAPVSHSGVLRILKQLRPTPVPAATSRPLDRRRARPRPENSRRPPNLRPAGSPSPALRRPPANDPRPPIILPHHPRSDHHEPSWRSPTVYHPCARGSHSHTAEWPIRYMALPGLCALGLFASSSVAPSPRRTAASTR